MPHQEVQHFPNGYDQQASIFFTRLMWANLNPRWVRVNGEDTITLPEDEVSRLIDLQQAMPSVYGNPYKKD